MIKDGINPSPVQQANAYYAPQADDLEKNDNNLGEEIINNGIHASIRIGFIRKVYGILIFQLALTIGVASLAFVDSINNFLIKNTVLLWVSIGLMFIVLIPLACCKKVAKTVPINYILLTIFTICESILIGYCLARVSWTIALTAAIMTLVIVISLMVYAWTAKEDFTFCAAMLFAFSGLMLTFAIFSIFFRVSPFLHTLYCCCGVLIFSIYLIFDTQLLLGKFGVEFDVDDYVFAALNIYLDIIQIFLYILAMLSRK